MRGAPRGHSLIGMRAYYTALVNQAQSFINIPHLQLQLTASRFGNDGARGGSGCG